MRQFVVNEEGERMAVVLPLEELRATPRGGGGDSQDEALLRRRVPGPEHERQAGVIGAGLDVWESISRCARPRGESGS